MPVPTLDELNLLHSNVCHAVGDPKRIQILYALHEQPRHVSALAEVLETPQPTISRHLTILRERGLVVGVRDGATVVYHLPDERIIHVLNVMRGLLREILERRHSMVDPESSPL